MLLCLQCLLILLSSTHFGVSVGVGVSLEDGVTEVVGVGVSVGTGTVGLIVGVGVSVGAGSVAVGDNVGVGVGVGNCNLSVIFRSAYPFLPVTNRRNVMLSLPIPFTFQLISVVGLSTAPFPSANWFHWSGLFPGP